MTEICYWQASVDWQAVDDDREVETAPPRELHNELVWINEEFYHGLTMGYFDGFTWRTFAGSDDVSVTHWARIDYPPPPPAGD